ncbi:MULTISPECIES: AI-2E family transporter [Methylobacterium]|uniref:Transport protein YhhT n=2 Tax=Pseudomonadota TaxID=1224 RepID=A0ABQ4T0U3_9HYPH|nr:MULTISPECIES: AI-2E family transporter [Methylobacterium]PIU08373.1 MAG: AI-2E family transporter [Methylobacterium sp. CG09_land_8_20_14_0_10_71_15]PIU13554.1 MAG: AI-2E family transporter [Methylobacterium sp. CG08_land_8_20_14_0_20_71_15]GBU18715.1 AI-2E family transporter [Methylobacterium sp.]GJE07778.1 Putative transport protein YhhT [Methylobacterium jeotgali]
MRGRVIIGTGALVLFVALLYLLRDVLMPFIAGFILAYLLDPLADRLERLGLGRLAASLVILALAVAVLVVTLLILAPVAVKQIAGLAAALPGTVQRLQAILAEHAGPLLQKVGGADVLSDLQSSVGTLAAQGGSWLMTFLASLWTGSQALVSIVSLLVVTPVVAFYILVDWDRMIAKLDGWTPPRHRPVVRRLGHEIDGAVTGFIRGQTLVCLILGTFYAVGLWAVGLNFGVLIGMIAGLLTFIPYVGTLTGFLLSVGVAVVQFWPGSDWLHIGLTVGVFLVGQFFEGNILSPKLVGDSVGLHPVWLMFALLAAGSLFGFAGLLLAVPVAASLGVVARFGIERYLSSRLYHDGQPVLLPEEVRRIEP